MLPEVSLPLALRGDVHEAHLTYSTEAGYQQETDETAQAATESNLPRIEAMANQARDRIGNATTLAQQVSRFLSRSLYLRNGNSTEWNN